MWCFESDKIVHRLSPRLRERMFPLRRLTSSVLLFSLLATFPFRAVGRGDAVISNVDEATSEETGLQFRLSHGVNQPETRPTTKPAIASELSQSEIEPVLKRLPPMKVDPSEEFAMRESTLPPPRTGNTIEASFPAATTDVKEAVTSGPLEVVRYSPEGSVPMAPELTVTFSQPMIELSSQEDAATNLPVNSVHNRRESGDGWEQRPLCLGPRANSRWPPLTAQVFRLELARQMARHSRRRNRGVLLLLR